METKKQNNFLTKDILSICFSLAALILSLSSFYFSNIRIDDDLQARVAGIRTISGRHPSYDGRTYDTISTQVAFFNRGNRQAIILGAKYQITPKPVLYESQDSFESDDFPLILNPHEMKLISLKFCTRYMTFDPGIKSKSYLGLDEHFLSIVYNSIDSEGKKHIALQKFAVVIYTKKGVYSTFKDVDNYDKSIATNLFSDK
ncbi:hypothetical protein QQY79_17420 [Flavobacterium tructae]|uniref:hypothetical protein n=1 Tax=Flavobacterium TaxID=237 RepID=UPI00201F0B0D|nr:MULTISPECIES: hypothetical protein [Flavobacterium]MDL2144310.1 hypothetical protein [Flavobacterium tructae]URC11720.1 hypothetical protein M4I44_16670 [Flavobacterium sp. B183]